MFLKWTCRVVNQRNQSFQSKTDKDTERVTEAVDGVPSIFKVHDCTRIFNKRIESLLDSFNFCSKQITEFEKILP